jgi:hypothetical protein
MRVADFVANFIYEELNVQHVFTVTGAGIMHLTDGLASHKKLKPLMPVVRGEDILSLVFCEMRDHQSSA